MQNKFNGKRLTEARELRSMTKVSLSSISGISRLSITQYEKGEQNPRHDVVEKLANYLNVPYEFFFTESSDISTKSVFFRSFSAATKSERTRSETKLKWLKEIYLWLADYIEIPNFEIPDFGINENNYLTLTNERIESIVEELRVFWGLEHDPILNLTNFLEHKGVIISLGEAETNNIDAFSEWDFANGFNPIIFVGSDKKSAVRCRFALAHELGHMILHHKIPKERMNQKNHRTRERQANYFASAFLLPAETFLQSFSRPTLEQFVLNKKKLKVSVAAMIKRANALRVIEESEQTSLFKLLSKRGWRLREPFDDEILFEESMYLKRCIELLLEEKLITLNDLVELTFPIEELETLLNLEKNFISNKLEEKSAKPKLRLLKFK